MARGSKERELDIVQSCKHDMESWIWNSPYKMGALQFLHLRRHTSVEPFKF